MDLMSPDPDLVLTDGTVTLRPPTPADAEPMAALVRSCLAHLQDWMLWATDDYDADQALEYIERKLDPTSHPLVILDADGRFVGNTGLNDIDGVNFNANLGYWLHPDATGRGVATRATDLVLRYGIELVGLQRIEIFLSVHNEPSRRVAERSIAMYEGIQRNRLRYRGEQHDAHVFTVVAADLG